MRCLLSTRFVMTAEILRNTADIGSEPGTIDVNDNSQWQEQQDPITGEIIRVWVPVTQDEDDDPLTPASRFVIPCEVHGIVDGGIRVAGTTERFGKQYDSTDFAKMTFPAGIILTKADRVTNIRNKRTGEIIWKEEELDKVNGDYRATVFNVNGVTPQPDPFGRVVSQFALLSRAEAGQTV